MLKKYIFTGSYADGMGIFCTLECFTLEVGSISKINAILKILIRLTIKIVYFTRFSLSLQLKPKHITIMTTLAQRISETPMAPYVALLRGMTREQKRIVVTYLTESMEEPKTKRQVPAEFKKLRGIVNITEEEMARDEHLAHIMER